MTKPEALTAPVVLPVALAVFGTLHAKMDLHWTDADKVVVSARSINHPFPIAQNIQDVCALLEIDLTGIEVIGNETGMFARVEVPRAVVEGGNAVALALLLSADATAAVKAAAGAAALAKTGEPAEA